jgi:methionyl-tRNA formyltransferase
MRVDRLIRACTPAPGAWAEFRGQRVKLGPVRPQTDAAEPASGSAFEGDKLAPGEIRAGKHRVLVGTGSHPVELGEVQPQGKREMTAAEWARGVRVTDHDRLD